MNILEVENLKTYFITDRGLVRPVRDVSFHVADGEIIGIVGESGSGKSVSMYSTLGLVAKNGYVTQGKVSFNGDTILHIPPREGEVSLDTLKKEKKQSLQSSMMKKIFITLSLIQQRLKLTST